MGSITELNSGRQYVLAACHVVGRDNSALLQVSDSSISLQHACLRWTGRYWAVKDLGSTNGTYVDGKGLAPGVLTTIHRSAQLRFARDRSVWVLSDDSPPQLMMISTQTGVASYWRDGMIAIPTADEPTGLVYQDSAGGWILEKDGEVQSIDEGRRIEIFGSEWMLCNSSLPPPTSFVSETGANKPLENVVLRFRVSRDEEHVELVALDGSRTTDFSMRSHHYMLLTLARVRLEDEKRGEQRGSVGWIAQEDLLRKLRTTPDRLNVDVFRARKQFASAGFFPPAGIVERRSDSRQLRIGTGSIQVEVV